MDTVTLVVSIAALAVSLVALGAALRGTQRQ